MAPAHYVVIEGLVEGEHSDYSIQATGDIEKVDGMLGGVSVSKNPADEVSGSSVDGRVWAGADGFRIYGGLKNIDIERPENVQVHIGSIADRDGDTDTGRCQKQIVAKSVEFLSGQGAGEGKLELRIEHNSGTKSIAEDQNVPVGTTQPLNGQLSSFYVSEGDQKTQNLTTKVTEKEKPRDWFTGEDDFGESTKEITLRCGETKDVSQTVKISSDRDNPAKVRVNYTIQDTFQD